MTDEQKQCDMYGVLPHYELYERGFRQKWYTGDEIIIVPIEEDK